MNTLNRILSEVLLVLLVLLAAAAPINSQEEPAPTPAIMDITLPTYQGYISVAPNGRYFVDELGQGFLVIGQNDAISWPGLQSLLDSTSPDMTEQYIMDLRAHGVTVSRIMMEYTQFPFSLMENPIGEFSPSVVAFWDQFIALAEKHGLYLKLTPYDTFWQFRNWESYPYNAAMGGPCPSTSEWLSNRDCIEAQKNRWRFIIDHWGDSPNIFAWDLMNEVDLWWGANAEEINAYITEMAAFVRQYETERWGRTRLISVSSAASVPEGRLGEIIYNHPDLDFANTHLYLGPAIKDPQDTIAAAPMMAGGVALSLDQIEDDRPFFDSESGPIDNWIVNPRMDAEYHHNMSWAHLAAGGAGTGMRWPYTNPHVILPEMRDNLLGIARLASTIDWANYVSRNATLDILVSTREIIRIGMTDGQTALIWLLADTRQNEVTLPGAVVTLNDNVLADGSYRVEYWETYRGYIVEEAQAEVTHGELQLTLPDSLANLKDVAIVLRAE